MKLHIILLVHRRRGWRETLGVDAHVIKPQFLEQGVATPCSSWIPAYAGNDDCPPPSLRDTSAGGGHIYLSFRA